MDSIRDVNKCIKAIGKKFWDGDKENDVKYHFDKLVWKINEFGKE